ncbi:uncharacterized protein LOC125178212, partial [Hyalella azteca]|uniref:Uncharacterized protein LOC125178212 n=1 Tax=Hyalella azteca TaxID=294128 RepID=A0A979FMF2_HYAAZ
MICNSGLLLTRKLKELVVGSSDPTRSTSSLSLRSHKTSVTSTQLKTSKSITENLTSLSDDKTKSFAQYTNVDPPEVKESEKDHRRSSFSTRLEFTDKTLEADRNNALREPLLCPGENSVRDHSVYGKNISLSRQSRRSKSVSNLALSSGKLSTSGIKNQRDAGDIKVVENYSEDCELDLINFSREVESRSSVRELAKKLEKSLTQIPRREIPPQISTPVYCTSPRKRVNTEVSCLVGGVVHTKVALDPGNLYPNCYPDSGLCSNAGSSCNDVRLDDCQEVPRFAESRKLLLYSDVGAEDHQASARGNGSVEIDSFTDIEARQKKCSSTPNFIVRKKKKPRHPTCEALSLHENPGCHRNNPVNEDIISPDHHNGDLKHPSLLRKLTKLKIKFSNGDDGSSLMTYSLDRRNKSHLRDCSELRKLSDTSHSSTPKLPTVEFSPVPSCKFSADKSTLNRAPITTTSTMDCQLSPGFVYSNPSIPRIRDTETDQKTTSESEGDQLIAIKGTGGVVSKVLRSSSLQLRDRMHRFPNSSKNDNSDYPICEIRKVADNSKTPSPIPGSRLLSNETETSGKNSNVSSPNFDYRRFLAEKVLGYSPPPPAHKNRAVPQVAQSATRMREARVPLVTWEPQFCVLLQEQATLTAYRAEEMA